MFIYLIIAFELALLYTVFWYGFVYEPKPFRIKGDPWGTYGKSESDDTAAAETSEQNSGRHAGMSGSQRIKSDPRNGWVVANFGRLRDPFQS